MPTEGYWRQRKDVSSEKRSQDEYQWPIPDLEYDAVAFLAALEAVEKKAEIVGYRGWSNCRLCAQTNGSREFNIHSWVWPEGFRHYVAVHRVRPSVDFESFILREAKQ